jgi:hypothetical protein
MAWPQSSFGHYIVKRAIVTGLCIAFVFYPTVAAAVLSIFSCVAIDTLSVPSNAALEGWEGKSMSGQYWSEDTSVVCWQSLKWAGN